MWQIELINFSHLSIHLSSQPANVYSTLGIGNMQGSGASKMKLRHFLLLYREEYLSLCSWTGCFPLGSPKLDLQLFFGWGIAEWASWFFPFRAQILRDFSSLLSVIWPPGHQEHRREHCGIIFLPSEVPSEHLMFEGHFIQFFPPGWATSTCAILGLINK